LPAGLAVPSAATVYGAAIDLRECLVIGISQRGATPDVAEYVASARAAGALTLAITNDDTSLLAGEAHRVLTTQAGVERAVAATKTCTSQLAVLASFWAAWLDDRDFARSLQDEVPAAMSAAYSIEAETRAIATRLSHTDRLIVAGRGFNYATAIETALKVKETSYVAAMPFSAADLMHGPIAMGEPQYPVLVFAPQGKTQEGMAELQRELQRRGAETYVVTDATRPTGGATGTVTLPRSVPDALSPLVNIIPGQFLALHLALARGLDPDRPRGLSKITRTR
jgi:glucosamine--fructose-6-phosphate aminotransferase (isomerizing)